MSTCVVYFSLQGNTKAAAELLAKNEKADLIEVPENKNYKGIIGFMRAGFRAATGACADIDPGTLARMASYDAIVVASPVWAGKTCPVFNAVLAKADLKGKKVIAVTVQADPELDGHSAREEAIKTKLAEREAVFGGCYSVCGAGPGKGVFSDEKIKQQIDAIKLG